MAELTENEQLVLENIRGAGTAGIYWMELLDQVRVVDNSINKSTFNGILKTLVECGEVRKDVVVNNSGSHRKTYWTKRCYEFFQVMLQMSHNLHPGFSADHLLALDGIADAGVLGLNFYQVKEMLNLARSFINKKKTRQILKDLLSTAEIFLIQDKTGNLINMFVDTELVEYREQMNQGENYY